MPPNVPDVTDVADPASLYVDPALKSLKPAAPIPAVPTVGPRPRVMYVKAVLGALFLIPVVPCMALLIGTSTLWQAVDPVTPWVSKKVQEATHKLWLPLVKKPCDTFMVNVVILGGVCVPALFAFCLHRTLTHGFSLPLAFLYNLLRIGPYFMLFAYVYVLSHKEGHRPPRNGLFNVDATAVGPLARNVFNWWIGPFYGVLPSNFRFGHTRNHHKYENGEKDVISNWDTPRDDPVAYLAYMPRFLMYVLNISPMIQFIEEKRYDYVGIMLASNIYYGLGFFLAFRLSPAFAIAYLGYPFCEAMVLLSTFNWAWHVFLDPLDPDNEYASSITVLDGPVNVLNEDYHLVHHQTPGAHWTQHPELYEKKKAGYVVNRASILRGTHALELFFLALLGEHKKLAGMWVDLTGEMTMEEKEQLVVARMRAVTWGPLKNTVDPKKVE